MKYSIVTVTSSGEFRNLHLPGRDRGGGSSIELKSFELHFHRRLARDFHDFRRLGGSPRAARSLQQISTTSREIQLRRNRLVWFSPLFLYRGLTPAYNDLHGGEKNRAKKVIE